MEPRPMTEPNPLRAALDAHFWLFSHFDASDNPYGKCACGWPGRIYSTREGVFDHIEAAVRAALSAAPAPRAETCPHGVRTDYYCEFCPNYTANGNLAASSDR